MTDTISSFRVEVREILKDTANDPHNTDEQIDRAVRDGFMRMFAVRPESRCYTGVIVDYNFPSTPSDLASFQVSFDPRWRLGIVYFAVARRYESDVNDAVNRELAASYFKQADAVFSA